MLDISRHIGECKFILVSNREPYEHVAGPLGVEVRQPPGGLVSALDPTMREIHGTWVAWGSGSADRETADQSGCVRVPPEAPAYTLRRVWLDDDDVEGYYHGFANRALWPLCHMQLQHLEFRSEHWERYRAVNLRFAHAVVDEAERCAGRTMVWIQDYHFALVAEFLRAIQPNVFTHQFWHIPFPPPDVMNLLPVNANVSLLKGLLGNDLVEFQTERHVTNFLQCVDAFVSEADVDLAGQRVRFRGRTVEAAAFPISIDVQRFDQMARSEAAVTLMATLRDRYARDGRQLGVCVDRVDYTKGIPERLRALAHLWETEPGMRGRATFLFVCTPSRSVLPAYAALEREVMELVMEVNERFGRDDWTPIVLVNSNVDADLLAACYRAADLCLVSSLQDGMNLVAKEFVGCQVDERGVLVLSRFTGAAEEIDGAILINPFNLDGFASAIRVALDMPVEERRRRMRRMRMQLSRATIFDWVDGILAHAASLMAVERPSTTRQQGEGTDERSPEAFL